MLRRVVAFGNLNVSLFPENSVAVDLLKAIEFGVATISDEIRNQLSAEALMKAGMKAKVAARETLKGHIIRVGEISRALEGDVKLPDARSAYQCRPSTGGSLGVDEDRFRRTRPTGEVRGRNRRSRRRTGTYGLELHVRQIAAQRCRQSVEREGRGWVIINRGIGGRVVDT
jgi:hypothetical protein